MRPSAGVYERIRQQHHLRLQCRRKAHFQNDQRHNVQLLLLGRSADGDDLGQQQVALYLRLHWPGVCDVQRQQVFLPEKCPRRCHRSCECQRHSGGVLHLRSLGRAHVHRRHHGRHPRRREPPALSRVCLRQRDRPVLPQQPVL